MSFSLSIPISEIISKLVVFEQHVHEVTRVYANAPVRHTFFLDVRPDKFDVIVLFSYLIRSKTEILLPTISL